jgi:hypothetical protein
MKEVDIVKAIMRYLKTVPECFCWKEHGGMYETAGIPDIIACIGGRFYGFEVKTDSGKPTKLQEATIRKNPRSWRYRTGGALSGRGAGRGERLPALIQRTIASLLQALFQNKEAYAYERDYTL